MTLIPKGLLAFGTRVLAWNTARKLRQPGRALVMQEKIFRSLIRNFSRTAYGRDHGITAGMSYEEFQAKIPPRTYESFAPYVERMKRGEADVLWPGRCTYYAVSSGTTAGRTKYLPITREMIAHFSQAGLDSLLFYTLRKGDTDFFRGRHLFLGGSTTLTPIPESKPFIAYGGDLSGITSLNLPGWVDRHLYEPGAQIAQMSDWPTKLKAIAERTRDRDIRMVAGIPSWVLILADVVRANAPGGTAAHPTLQSIWPNLECFVHGGVPIGPFEAELKRALGPQVNFHELYPASEAFIAAQDATPADGLRLMTEAGIFFEFLPLRDFDPERLPVLGPKIVPLAGVKVGEDYALLLSTPAGLSRYVIGDVVRFISMEPPRLIYVGRTALQLSAFGEHVIEKELTDALTSACRLHGGTIVNFHVAPKFIDLAAGQDRGRHEWWIELRADGGALPDRAALAAEIDRDLMVRNDDYEAKRKGGGLDTPLLHLVPAGTFERWMRDHGKWGGQSKMPRCRSDRNIGNELAALIRG